MPVYRLYVIGENKRRAPAIDRERKDTRDALALARSMVGGKSVCEVWLGGALLAEVTAGSERGNA